jgi:hypothetical protein
VRLRRGIKAWAKYLAGHLEVGRRGVAGGDGRKRPGSVGAVGKTQLLSEARLTERRGRGGRLERARTKKENVFLVKTRPTRGLVGPAGMVSACRLDGHDRWAGWARGRAGHKVGRAESKEKEFPN